MITPKKTLQLIKHIAQHRCMWGMSYLLCVYLAIVQSGLDDAQIWVLYSPKRYVFQKNGQLL